MFAIFSVAEAEEEEGEGEQEEEASAEEGAQEGPRGGRAHPRHLSGKVSVSTCGSIISAGQ